MRSRKFAMARLPSRLIVLCWAVVASGCLSSTYTIRQDELMRISQLPPELRGREVRATQAVFGGSPGSGYSQAPEPAVTPGRVTPGQIVSAGVATQRSFRAMNRGFRAMGRAAHRASGGGGPSFGGSRGSTSGGSRGSRSDDSGIDLSGEGAAVAVAVIAVAVVTIGVVIMATLAATEGSRFDGWVAVDPSQSLYLVYQDGSREIMPLWMLTPQHAWSAQQGFFVSTEGPYLREVRRATLDRVGGLFSLDVGASGTSANGAWWPQVQFGIGGFFLQQLGVMATIGGVFGSQDGLLFNLRYGGEIQGYPLEVPPFSLGLYAQAFDNHRLQELASGDLEQVHAFGWSAGISMQLEVTTRLAITIRGGPTMVHEPNNDVITGGVTVGATVY